MFNLKNKSKESLLLELKDLVNQERKLISQVLDYLKEVENRKLYLEIGFSSLFEFCVKELGYSEPSAQRRISAMRLIKDIPEIKTKLEKGSLNLTTINQASLFISQERRMNNKVYSNNQKRELLLKLENKSKKQCELELVKIAPNAAILQERERVVAEDKIEIKFTISGKLKAKLDRVRALISHKNSNPSYEELLEELAEMALKKLDLTRAPSPAKVREREKLQERAKQQEPVKLFSRYIPIHIKKQVWQRDKGICQYVNPQSKKQCGSTHFIQIDHIKPYSQQGSSLDPGNLRLLCGKHNRWRSY